MAMIPLDKIKDQFGASTADIKSFFERLGKASNDLGNTIGKGFENEKQAASLATRGTMVGLFKSSHQRVVAESLETLIGQYNEKNLQKQQNVELRAEARMLKRT
jgi:hypothetical protein